MNKAAKTLLPKILVRVKYARAGIVLSDLRSMDMLPTLEPYFLWAKGIGGLLQEIRREHGVKAIDLGPVGILDGPTGEMAAK